MREVPEVSRISLIVTTYNWPAALELTLKSVARQSAAPLEVIVADDGSGATTRQVVTRWQERLRIPLVHVWQPDEGFRLARSRNRAIAAARGDYLIMVDGDMVLHRHFVADHARAARHGAFIQGVRLLTGPRAAAGMLTQGCQMGERNDAILRDAIVERKAWCPLGLSQHIEAVNAGARRPDSRGTVAIPAQRELA